MNKFNSSDLTQADLELSGFVYLCGFETQMETCFRKTFVHNKYNLSSTAFIQFDWIKMDNGEGAEASLEESFLTSGNQYIVQPEGMFS